MIGSGSDSRPGISVPVCAGQNADEGEGWCLLVSKEEVPVGDSYRLAGKKTIVDHGRKSHDLVVSSGDDPGWIFSFWVLFLFPSLPPRLVYSRD